MIYLNVDGSSGNLKLEQDVAQVYEETYARFKSEEFDKQFKELLESRFELFKRKQASYGPNNIAALGEKGIFVRMWDKVQRLRNLLWFGKPNSVEDESIEDTLSDLAVYAIMTIVLRKGQWPKYVEPPLEVPFIERMKYELDEQMNTKLKWETVSSEPVYQRENRDE